MAQVRIGLVRTTTDWYVIDDEGKSKDELLEYVACGGLEADDVELHSTSDSEDATNILIEYDGLDENV